MITFPAYLESLSSEQLRTVSPPVSSVASNDQFEETRCMFVTVRHPRRLVCRLLCLLVVAVVYSTDQALELALAA